MRACIQNGAEIDGIWLMSGIWYVQLGWCDVSGAMDDKMGQCERRGWKRERFGVMGARHSKALKRR
jgi:hypothetical protein